MSGSEPCRTLAPLALLLLLAMGCDASEEGSTLRSEGQEANPIDHVELGLAPPTAASLGEHVEAKARALSRLEYAAPDTVLPASIATGGTYLPPW